MSAVPSLPSAAALSAVQAAPDIGSCASSAGDIQMPFVLPIGGGGSVAVGGGVAAGGVVAVGGGVAAGGVVAVGGGVAAGGVVAVGDGALVAPFRISTGGFAAPRLANRIIARASVASSSTTE